MNLRQGMIALMMGAVSCAGGPVTSGDGAAGGEAGPGNVAAGSVDGDGGQVASGAPDASTTCTPSTLSGEVPVVPALTAGDLARTWAQLAAPGGGAVVQGASGFFGVFVNYGGKAGLAYSHVYHSDDGVTWHAVTLPTPPVAPPAWYVFRDIAYGGGRYLLVGSGGQTGTSAVWSSTDFATWSPVSVPAAPGEPPVGGVDIEALRRLEGRFFGFGNYHMSLSADGLCWSLTSNPPWQSTAIAFGNGTFVVASASSIRTSPDGSSWVDHSPPCSLSGAACVTAPGIPGSVPPGPTTPGPYYNAVFFGGRFYVDHVSSVDGATWESYDGAIANDAVGGWLFHGSGDSLQAWQPGQAPHTIPTAAPVSSPPLSESAPDTITLPLPTGETCATNRCVIVDRALYLIR